MIEHTFEYADPAASLAVVEETHREESKLMARQMAAIAELLTCRTAEAEGIDPDPGWSMITGFTRTCAEVGAALNMAPMDASKLVACAEALDTRLPRIFAMLADGRVDFPCARAVVTRTELVEDRLIGRVDEELAERIGGWHSWSRKRLITTVDSVVRTIDPEAAKERRARADGDRYVSTKAQPDGTAVLRGRISATAAATFEQRISGLLKSLCPKDSRTKDQRRADAFDAVMAGRKLVCDCGRAECPVRTEDSDDERAVLAVINVIATDATVSGQSEQPGYLEGFGVIDGRGGTRDRRGRRGPAPRTATRDRGRGTSVPPRRGDGAVGPDAGPDLPLPRMRPPGDRQRSRPHHAVQPCGSRYPAG